MRARPFATLFTLCAAAAGCSGSTEPDPLLAVSAVPSRTQAAAGETITFEVTATNVSDRHVTVAGAPSTMLEVRDASGGVVAFGRFEFVAMIPTAPTTLAPGEVLRDRAPWAGEIVASEVLASPGSYTVRAAVLAVDGKGRYAFSSPVEVVLTEP